MKDWTPPAWDDALDESLSSGCDHFPEHPTQQETPQALDGCHRKEGPSEPLRDPDREICAAKSTEPKDNSARQPLLWHPPDLKTERDRVAYYRAQYRWEPDPLLIPEAEDYIRATPIDLAMIVDWFEPAMREMIEAATVEDVETVRDLWSMSEFGTTANVVTLALEDRGISSAPIAQLVEILRNFESFRQPFLACFQEAGETIERLKVKLSIEVEDQWRHVAAPPEGAQVLNEGGQEGADTTDPMLWTDVGGSYVFRRDGQFWQIKYDGKQLPPIKDYIGLGYIAVLLSSPHKQVAAFELKIGYSLVPGQGPSATSGQKIMDDDRKAWSKLKEEHRNLEEEKLRAERTGDPAAIAGSQDSLNKLDGYLASGRGYAGRGRRFPDEFNNARIAVRSAIKRAIGVIAQFDETLGLHLEISINFGWYLVYSPDRPIPWEFS